MTIPKILAIRRDLESGYNAFKQIGNTVYHTLDGVNWVKAFLLPDAKSNTTVIQNSNITYKQLWRAIRIGDINGQKPEAVYPELKTINNFTPSKKMELGRCYAVRAIVNGVFAGFYQQFAKEYHINQSAAITEATVKEFIVNGPIQVDLFPDGSPLQFIGDISQFLGEVIAEYADEFALFFDELFYQLTAQFWAEIFNFDYSAKAPVLDALACDILTALGTDESYSNFKTVAGTALPQQVTDPDIVYQAWEEFASREIWQTYLLLSRSAPADYSSCPCGETCYSIMPSACIPLESQGQTFKSCVGEGDYLKNVVWNGTFQNRLEFMTYYPLGISTPKKLSSVHLVFETNKIYDTGTDVPEVYCFLQKNDGYYENNLPGFPFTNSGNIGVGAGSFEYSFTVQPASTQLYQAVKFRCDASYIVNDAANHAAVKAYVKSIIICVKD